MSTISPNRAAYQAHKNISFANTGRTTTVSYRVKTPNGWVFIPTETQALSMKARGARVERITTTKITETL